MLEAGKREWYVVYSKPRKEEYATAHLRLRGIEVYFPRLCLPQHAQERRPIIPLFPNYLFIKIRISDECNYVIWCPGVKRFVNFGSTPVPIEEQIVEFMMKQSNSEGVIMARSNLKIGEEVHITSGPFEGLIGIIQDPPDPKGRVKVLMTLLNRHVKVQVPVQFIKSEWAARPGV